MAPAASDDFLFGHLSPYCNASLDYSHAPSMHSAVGYGFMMLLYTLSAAFVFSRPLQNQREEAEERAAAIPHAQQQRAAGQSTRKKRWVLLDVARIACVFCVVIEHSGGWEYSEHNAGFGAHWALQYLFVISGISFMMSKASFGVFFRRYALLFVAGVSCNVVGDVLAPRVGWTSDLGNTVFQVSAAYMCTRERARKFASARAHSPAVPTRLLRPNLPALVPRSFWPVLCAPLLHGIYISLRPHRVLSSHFASFLFFYGSLRLPPLPMRPHHRCFTSSSSSYSPSSHGRCGPCCAGRRKAPRRAVRHPT